MQITVILIYWRFKNVIFRKCKICVCFLESLLFIFIFLKNSRHWGREWDRILICRFTFQMPPIARTGPGQSQLQQTQDMSPTWVAVTEASESSPAATRLHIGRKLHPEHPDNRTLCCPPQCLHRCIPGGPHRELLKDIFSSFHNHCPIVWGISLSIF